jgi:hypothetical protein
MMVETTERDVANAEALRRHEAMVKRAIWIIAAAGCLGGIVAGALAAQGERSPMRLLLLVGGAAVPVAILGVVLIVWNKGRARKLSTPGAMELRREDSDKGYRRFLTLGPWFLGYLALLLPYLIWRMKEELAKTPVDVIAYAYGAGILGFICMGGGYVLALIGKNRRALQDELTEANRASAVSLGFAASVPCAVALAALMIFAPGIGMYAAPALVVLPVILAMIRFGRLERAAARE